LRIAESIVRSPAALATSTRMWASEVGTCDYSLESELDFQAYATKEMRQTRSLKIALFFVISSVFLAVAPFGLSQGQPGGDTLSQAEINRIVAAFTAKETQFRQALNQYSFKRDAMIQSLGMGGQVIGEYRRVSFFTFDDSGNRYEKISFFPMSTLPEITQEDVDDLGGINPFALEPSKAALYNFRYAGKEKIDELNLYIFDVAPKVMPSSKNVKDRLFQGRVWVDECGSRASPR